MAYPGAAQALRAMSPGVVEAFRVGLLRLDSPLAVRPEAWRQCCRQAVAVLRECVDALEAGAPAPAEPMDDYTRLLGAYRALQQIAAAESVRAVEVLWSALEPAVRRAAICERPENRSGVWLEVNTAFRSSTAGRLRAGLTGYDETRGRMLAAERGEDASATGPPLQPDRGADSRPGPAQPADLDAPGTAAGDLTARERQVLESVARAMSNRQIARHLGISEATVKRHLSNIFGKLGATSRMDAVHKGVGRR